MIKLKGIKSADLSFFYDFRNNPEVWKWCRQNGPLSEEEHIKYWEKAVKDPSCKFFSVCEDTFGMPIGCAGFTSIDHVNSRAEFSLYIDPSCQGEGRGREALNQLFAWGFEYLNLNLIWGESFDGNPAMALFEKMGMTRDGIRRDFYFRGGKYVDAHLISMRREEWNTLKLSS